MLTGPGYGHIFSGPGEAVDLTFHGSVPLAANQWFRVQIDYKDRNNVMISWCGWSRSNAIRFPRDYFDDSWQMTREFRWHVNLVETSLRVPSTCAAAVDNSSPDSPAWLFYWY